MQIAKPFRLFFFRQANCGACALAQPEIDKFHLAHPEGVIVPVDARYGRVVSGFKAKHTPSYVFLVGGDKITHEGPLSFGDLEDILHEMTGEPDDEDGDEPSKHDDAGEDGEE